MDINKIYNMDCIDGLKQLDNDSVQLIITSPPYNINKKYEKKLDINEYIYYQFHMLSQSFRILKDNGSICYQIGNTIKDKHPYPLDWILKDELEEVGFKYQNRIIWTYNHGTNATYRFSGRYETILWFSKTDNYIFNLDPIRIPQKYPNKKAYKGKNKGKLSCNPLGKNPGDVWDITNIKHNHPEKTDHPCQFPEFLVERCILSMTNEDDLVVDPYMGSGTTAKVCKKYNRNYIGFDIIQEYIDIAEERLND